MHKNVRKAVCVCLYLKALVFCEVVKVLKKLKV